MRKILMLLSSLMLLVFIVANTVTANAGMFCSPSSGELGYKIRNYKSVPIDRGDIVLPKLGSRVYTITDLFQNSTVLADPWGIVSPQEKLFLNVYTENKLVEENGGSLNDEQKQRLTKDGCAIFHIGTAYANLSSNLSAAVTGIIKWLVTSLFSDNFICKDPDNPKGACINLLGIIGGKSDKTDGGLIGKLGNNIFLPLSIVAFLTTAMYIMYKGLFKREFRLGISSFFWALFAFVLGVIVIVNPSIVARGPQTINSAIAGCLLDAMQGGNCMDGTKGKETNKENNNVCESTSSKATASETAELRLSGLSCMVSKAFVIDGWARSQFGYSFDELWTKNPPGTYKAYTKIQGSADDYCVNMGSDTAPDSISNSTKFGSSPKCNIALAYLATQTQGDFGQKVNTEKIVATAALDPKMWSAFSGESRQSATILQFIAIIIAAIAFIPVTVYAHAYSFSATILMVFAPIFCLFAIHPGKGKKIFLGWLETVISNILKFISSAFLVLVMIVIFSTVLTQVHWALQIPVSIILVTTFMMYRGEFTNMVGSVSMGGISLSNKFAKPMQNASKAVLGGTIGGALTIPGAIKAQREKDKAKEAETGKSVNGVLKTLNAVGAATGAVGGGALHGGLMEMKRGRGFLANATREFDRGTSEGSKTIREAQKEQQAAIQRQKVMDEMREIATTSANQTNQQLDERELVQGKADLKDNTNQVVTQMQGVGLHSIADELKEQGELGKQAKTLEDFRTIKADFEAKEKIAVQVESHITNANSFETGIQNYGQEVRAGSIDKSMTSLTAVIESLRSKNTKEDGTVYSANIENNINEMENRLLAHLQKASDAHQQSYQDLSLENPNNIKLESFENANNDLTNHIQTFNNILRQFSNDVERQVATKKEWAEKEEF